VSEPATTILIVEDEPQMRRFLRTALTAQGFRIVDAETAKEALVAATTRSPDIILLDLGLPDADGIDLAREIRGWSRVPIIVISARGREDDKVAALDAGADDYLTKPFAFDVLLARIRARTRPAAEGQRIRFADLVLDLGTREARRGNRAITLTRTEFAILECLVRAAGRIVTRDRLIEEVWGDRDVTYNNLEAFVRLLRGKVDAEGQPALIHTERGIGYGLRSPA